MIDDNPRLKAWRDAVGYAALTARHGPLFVGPVEMDVRFQLPRPKRPKCAAAPCVPPDVDKLIRAIFDACSGVLYRDDGQVTDVTASKRYPPPGVRGSGMAIIAVRPARITWP